MIQLKMERMSIGLERGRTTSRRRTRPGSPSPQPRERSGELRRESRERRTAAHAQFRDGGGSRSTLLAGPQWDKLRRRCWTISLTLTVRVMHAAPLGTAARESHRQRGLDEFGPHVRRHADDAAAPDVEHDGQIQPVHPCGHVRDVGHPQLVAPLIPIVLISRPTRFWPARSPSALSAAWIRGRPYVSPLPAQIAPTRASSSASRRARAEGGRLNQS